jgi:hypothetical protein
MNSRSVFLLLLALGLIIMGGRVMPMAGVKGPVTEGTIVGLETVELKDGAPSAWGVGAIVRVSLSTGEIVDARGPIERQGGVGVRGASPPAGVLEGRLAARLRNLSLVPGETVKLAQERDKESGSLYWRAVETATFMVWFPTLLSWLVAVALIVLAGVWRARPERPAAPMPH